MKQLTPSQAVDFAESGIWKVFSDEKIVRLQLWQNYICVSWPRFCRALSAVLKRDISEREIETEPEKLRTEYLGLGRVKPELDEFADYIPDNWGEKVKVVRW